MTRLSNRCPVGFAFLWDGDCPNEPDTTWTLVRRCERTGIPKFDNGNGEEQWSARLEEVAQERWLHSIEHVGA